MDLSQLIPSADPIPVPWGCFYVLLLFTFVLHLLFMNTMLGIGVIALISHFKSSSNDSVVTHDIAKKLPYTIAFTVNMGVAPLLFLQVLYGHFLYVSSILMAVYWISIVGLLIVAYYSAYIYDFKYMSLGAYRVFFIGLTVFILLFIGFLFSNNLTLMLNPAQWKGYFQNRGGTLLNLSDPTLIPRYLHFVVASVAVGGLFVAWVARMKGSADPDARHQQMYLGLGWFSYGTLIQMVIGLWFLMALPKEIMLLFMGGDVLHSILFLAGLGGAALSLIFGFKKRLMPATLSLLATMILMVIMRDLVRTAYLKPYFSLSNLTLIPQWSPFLLFLCCFVVGLAMVAHMLRLAARAGKEA